MTTDFIKISKETFIKAAENMKVASGIEQCTSGRIAIILIEIVITFF